MPNWKKLITSGSDAALNSLNVTSALTASGLIYPTTDGDNGDFLTTDGIGNLSFGRPNVYANVKNISGGQLLKGTPVHATGTAGNTSEVIAASASVASTMPATFILNETLADDAEGLAILTGYINGVNTSAFGEGDVVYVGPTGSFTNIKPQGSDNLIQNLGIITKVDASNGSGYVYGSGRSNDVPNLPEGKVWVGSSTYSVTSSVAHLDETNERLGINTNTPGASLDVIGDISGSTKITIGTSHTNSGTLSSIAGGNSNTIASACSFIGGGSSNCVDGSSACAFIGGGESNSVLSSCYSAIAGGCNNIVSGNCALKSFIGGGTSNTIYANGGAIVGGAGNCVAGAGDGINSTIGGGYSNKTCAPCGFIGGGVDNEIVRNLMSLTGCAAVIGGGGTNVTNANHSFIGGGCSNCISCQGCCSGVGGGQQNAACGAWGFIGGGCQNLICSGETYATIGGGRSNKVDGDYSSIVGGSLNTASAACTGILGGESNYVNHANSFIIGSNLTSDKACYTFMNNLDVAGIVSGSTFSGSFVGDGSGLTGIVGQSIIDGTAAANQIAVFNSTTTISGSGNLTYDGTTLDTNGNLDVAGTVRLGYTGNDPVIFGNPAGKRTEWNNPGYFEIYAEDTDSPGTFRETVDIDGDFRGGGFIGVYPSNTDNRPGVQIHSAPDNGENQLQILPFTPTGGTQYPQIYAAYISSSAAHTSNINYTGSFIHLSGSYDNKIIIGTCVTDANVGSNNLYVVGDIAGTTKLTIGSNHCNTGTLSSIVGGTLNTASVACSFIGGGCSNYISYYNANSKFDIIVGGDNNTISNNYCSCNSTIVGGKDNSMSGAYGRFRFIGGGDNNTINGTFSRGVIVGGCTNSLYGSTNGGVIVGGALNIVCRTGNIVGGTSNLSCGAEDFIGAGKNNSISGYYSYQSAIVGGCCNSISGAYCKQSFIGGGCQNIICDTNNSVIVGGTLNTASAACSFIGGGYNSSIIGDPAQLSTRSADVIVGGCNNQICGCCNTNSNAILGGQLNIICASYSVGNTIGGGCSNVISGDYRSFSFISNGYQNVISAGSCNGILGGYNNTLTHNHSFIIGCNLSSTAVNYTFMNNACVAGTTRTTALVETSAKRFKECILPLQDQIENIKKLEPVEFQWKKDKTKDIGFIAEDVKEIYPDLVAYEEDGEISGVQYSKLTTVLVKALQQQQEQIQELKKEIFILKQQR